MTAVLGCLKLDFALHTSCGWQHKNMIAEEVERVEVGHPLWYSTMETVVLGCLKLDFALHTSCGWQHKNMIAEEVERVEVGHPL